MRRKAVESETISAIGYAPGKCELDIEFRQSGDIYRYLHVSAAEHADFMAAQSKGTHLNRVFKAKAHAYVVLKRGRK